MTEEDEPQGVALAASGEAAADAWHDRAAGLVLGGVALLSLLTMRDYGYSWDEVWQNRVYGQAVLAFVESWGADRSALTTGNFFLYGGLHDGLAELLARLAPLDGFTARRLANVAMGTFGLVGVWTCARSLFGPRAGFWAAALLAATPAWYGHVFINAKDVPFAVGYIWSLHFILRFGRSLPRPPWRVAVGLGSSLGLALGVRVGGLLPVTYLLVMLGGAFLMRLTTRDRTELPREAGVVLVRVLAALALGGALMVAFWPAALLDPASTLTAAFQAARRFPWAGNILFNGEVVHSSQLPWSYLPISFGVKLPIPVLLACAGGLVWGGVSSLRALRRKRWKDGLGPALLSLAALFPPLYATLIQATVYDGIRHFLFVLPPLTALAGGATAWFVAWIAARSRPVLVVLFVLLGCGVVHHLWTLVQLHPYQYAYHNLLAGGMPAAASRYETEYWITSYKEAAERLTEVARERAREEGVPFEQRRFRVLVFDRPENVAPFVPPNVDAIRFGSFGPADYYLTTTRFGGDEFLPGWRTIAVVERLGMPFAVVKTSLPPL